MAINKITGDQGELDVVSLVKCPNCSKLLMTLPPNYPSYDLQCTGCLFRAQVKTVSSKPKATFFGAGWEIMDKVLKSGFMVPPLFVNFQWSERGVPRKEIRFYPFIPKKHLRKYQLSATARRANYKMFHYCNMNDLPFMTLSQK